LFLVLVSVMMMRADHDHVRRNAIEQSEGAAVVLTLVILAAAVSIFAIVAELASAKAPGAHLEIQHVLFALVTVTGAWLLLPTLFAMNYASLFYQSDRGTGLLFPSLDKTFKPDYADFMYFSFTIAVASQTADVDITTRSMRRLVLLHSVLSFVFNTTILAFTINIAASLFWSVCGSRENRSTQKLRLASHVGDDAVFDAQQIVHQPTYGARIQHMLSIEHARRQRLGRIACHHRNNRLRDDRAMIEERRHEVHRRPCQLAPRFDRTAMRMQPGECREQ
jgi:uncharacterized membrane protein